MHKLTDKRKERASGILAKHNGRMKISGIDAANLERELIKCWGLAYQDIKEIMIDMFDHHPEYKELSISYMKHFPSPEFSSCFQKYREEGGDIWPEKGDP